MRNSELLEVVAVTEGHQGAASLLAVVSVDGSGWGEAR